MEMERIITLLATAWESPIIQLVVWCILTDTVFGCFRAIKEHVFNSCFGIDGALRKVSMLSAIAFLAVFDTILHVNLISLIPQEIKSYLPVETIGVTDFFGLIFIAYETVSILKNMTLCGLPVKKLWLTIRKWLTKYTDELPDNT